MNVNLLSIKKLNNDTISIKQKPQINNTIYLNKSNTQSNSFTCSNTLEEVSNSNVSQRFKAKLNNSQGSVQTENKITFSPTNKLLTLQPKIKNIDPDSKGYKRFKSQLNLSVYERLSSKKNVFTEKINKSSFVFNSSKSDRDINIQQRKKEREISNSKVISKNLENNLNNPKINIDYAKNPYTQSRMKRLNKHNFIDSVKFTLGKTKMDTNTDISFLRSKNFNEFKVKESKVLSFTKNQIDELKMKHKSISIVEYINSTGKFKSTNRQVGRKLRDLITEDLIDTLRQPFPGYKYNNFAQYSKHNFDLQNLDNQSVKRRHSHELVIREKFQSQEFQNKFERQDINQINKFQYIQIGYKIPFYDLDKDNQIKNQQSETKKRVSDSESEDKLNNCPETLSKCSRHNSNDDKEDIIPVRSIGLEPKYHKVSIGKTSSRRNNDLDENESYSSFSESKGNNLCDSTFVSNNNLEYTPSRVNINLQTGKPTNVLAYSSQPPIKSYFVQAIQLSNIDVQILQVHNQLKGKTDTNKSNKNYDSKSDKKNDIFKASFDKINNNGRTFTNSILIQKLTRVKVNAQKILLVIRLRHFSDQPNIRYFRNSTDKFQIDKYEEQFNQVMKYFKDKEQRQTILSDLLKQQLIEKWVFKIKRNTEKIMRNEIKELETRAILEDQKNLRKWQINYLSKTGQDLDFHTILKFQSDDIIEQKSQQSDLNNKIKRDECTNRKEYNTWVNQLDRLTKKLNNLEQRYNIINNILPNKGQNINSDKMLTLNNVDKIQTRYIKKLYIHHWSKDPNLKMSIELRHANHLNVVSKMKFINNSLHQQTNTMSISMFKNKTDNEGANIGDFNFQNMVLRRTEMLNNIQTNVKNLFETKIQQLDIELNYNQALNINLSNNANVNSSLISQKNSIINHNGEGGKDSLQNIEDSFTDGKHFSDLTHEGQSKNHLNKMNIFKSNSGKPSLSTKPVIVNRSCFQEESIICSKFTDSTYNNSNQLNSTQFKNKNNNSYNNSTQINSTQFNKKNNNSLHKETTHLDSQESENTSGNFLKVKDNKQNYQKKFSNPEIDNSKSQDYNNSTNISQITMNNKNNKYISLRNSIDNLSLQNRKNIKIQNFDLNKAVETLTKKIAKANEKRKDHPPRPKRSHSTGKLHTIKKSPSITHKNGHLLGYKPPKLPNDRKYITNTIDIITALNPSIMHLYNPNRGIKSMSVAGSKSTSSFLSGEFNNTSPQRDNTRDTNLSKQSSKVLFSSLCNIDDTQQSESGDNDQETQDKFEFKLNSQIKFGNGTVNPYQSIHVKKKK